MNLNTTTVITEDWALLVLEGTLDVSAAEEVLHDVRTILRSGCPNVKLDLESVEYISSAGVRALLLIKQETEKEAGVSVAIVRASKFVTGVVKMAGMQDLFNLSEDGETALPAQSMRCTIQKHPLWTELTIAGSLNVFSVTWLVEKVRSLIQHGTRHLRLNGSQVAYISSAGVRSLLLMYKEMSAAQGSFRVTEPSEDLRKVLRMAGIESLLVTD